MPPEAHYKIAIVGAGPAGLSAAARAAALDAGQGLTRPAHVLLEAFERPSKTIYRYQKGKHVMAEPGYLRLRSDMPFEQGKREAILDNWDQQIREQRINIRYNARVTAISGSTGQFVLALESGDTVSAERVVLALGTEGNPRLLGVDGDTRPRVQYQLDDPDEYRNETIIVVGAGDSAVENALALARNNRVYILNRQQEFARIKDGNRDLLLAALNSKSVQLACFYSSVVAAISEIDGSPRLRVTINTADGEQTIEADRIIARLGSVPPRGFLEACGISLPGKHPTALPELSDRYESNRPGIYVIGSLAGYPLIKQAMNQGHDVIEFICGNRIQTIEQQLLEYQFRAFPFEAEADAMARLLMARVPMFSLLNVLVFRELVIESDIYVSYADPEARAEALEILAAQRQQIEAAATPGQLLPRTAHIIDEGAEIYATGDFGVSFFTVLDGEVILTRPDYPERRVVLGKGLFFGETSLIAGQPRQETVVAGANCIVMETPRRTILKLMSSNEAVRKGIEWLFVVRELQRVFVPDRSVEELRPYADRVQQHLWRPGATIWATGDAGSSVHIVRSGTVALYREEAGVSAVVAEVRAGELIGQAQLFSEPRRQEQAKAAVATATLEIPRELFHELMALQPGQLEVMRERVSSGLLAQASWQVRRESGELLHFLLGEGLGEATNALLIDEYLCVGCDNCETACAETHDGISRLRRKAGETKAHLHVPVSCRHCQQPHCMKDCPPNAIHRASTGEVFIDDSCIGCGNCASNCPYGVIEMGYPAAPKPGLFSWLLLGRGPGPGQGERIADPQQGQKAYKCDACLGRSGGPACVTACPTGAARRVSPQQFVAAIERSR